MTALGTVYPAPGYTDECLHVYHARLAVAPGALRPDDDEKLEVEVLTRQQIEHMIAGGEIVDAKTLAAWLLYTARATDRSGS